MVLIFYCGVQFFLKFAFFIFLFDLFINMVRKLEVAVSNHERHSGLLLSLWVGFLSFSFSFTFYLSLSLFVDSGLQLLLCGLISPSLILIINEL